MGSNTKSHTGTKLSGPILAFHIYGYNNRLGDYVEENA